MKIESNKTFECYETACESWYSGKDITLDGVKLISITVFDKIRAEIINLTDGDMPERIWNVDVLDILDKYTEVGSEEK